MQPNDVIPTNKSERGDRDTFKDENSPDPPDKSQRMKMDLGGLQWGREVKKRPARGRKMLNVWVCKGVRGTLSFF